MDVDYTYYDDHFALYTNIESLSCITETNTVLHFNYISVKRQTVTFLTLVKGTDIGEEK